MYPVQPDSVCRVALVGGDGRSLVNGLPPWIRAEIFGSARDRGNGELRRLERALRAGDFQLVVLMVRWCGHSCSRTVTRLARLTKVPVLVVPGGGSSALRNVQAILGGGVW